MITTGSQTTSLPSEEMIPRVATLARKEHEIPGVATYSLLLKDPKLRSSYRFLPGQFNMLYLPGIGEVAISISSDPEHPTVLLHTIRIAGNVTQAADKLRIGDSIGIRGPYGSAWPVNSAYGSDVILVAGGIGLAPLRPVIYQIIRQRPRFGRVTILVGARAPAELLFSDEYSFWLGHDIEVIPTVDKADETWNGRVGVVPMLFYTLRPDPDNTTVYTCGPEIMMRFVIYEALARRIPKKRVFVSLERNMKCAIGFCGHCQYGSVFLCKEGPVLSYHQVEPYFNVEEY